MYHTMHKKSSTPTSWLAAASRQLAAVDIASARLDAEIILAHTLSRPRTWLHAHGDDEIDAREVEIADACFALRLEHVPIAYIIGHKDFYGRRFHVTPATLVPRPESETIITLLDQIIGPNQHTLLDVGTGSGCLGITAKLEHPELNVTLSDVSQEALDIAKKNARSLDASVGVIVSDLLTGAPGKFDIIIANLPYVDNEWETSPDIAHEPALALFAEDHGLALIKTLITQACAHLNSDGYLLLEADPCQHNDIISFAQEIGYSGRQTYDYIVVLSRQ